MIFDGKNGGTVELLDNALVIRRYGVPSALNQGLTGEKRIPYSSITSIQLKDAGVTSGYIQFGIAGGTESRGGLMNATTDENTVLFTKAASEQFKQLRDLVEGRAHLAKNPQSRPTSSLSDELTKLADLRDRGVLTDEEFAAQKKRLLAVETPAPAVSNSEAKIAVAPAVTRRVNMARPQPEALKPKTSIGSVFGYGCLGFIGLIILLAAIGSNVEKTAGENQSDAFANIDTAATDTPSSASVATEPWSYSESDDKVRGGTTYSASTTSTNTIAQDPPYDSDTSMTMTLRKSPAFGTDVLLQISSGQMMCPSYSGCSGTVRFDDGPAQRVSFLGPEDNSNETVFVEGAKSFIAKLKKAKKVTIEKTLYQAGAPQFEFDVSGLKWSH